MNSLHMKEAGAEVWISESMPDSLAREAEPRNPSGNGDTAGHGRMFQVRLSHVYGRLQFWHQAFSNPTQRRRPPAVNQVEMNPPWRQRKLRDFSNERNSCDWMTLPW